MTKLQDVSRENDIPIITEFEPFSKKKLEQYLKQSQMMVQLLAERRQRLEQTMKTMINGPDKNGLTLQDRLEAYTIPGKELDAVGGGSGMHYNPDSLYNQYLKIYYEPIASQQKMLVRSMNRIMLEEMQLEKVNQCVDDLPIVERDIIVCVYINNETVKDYCRSKQMGHGKYSGIKESALKHLLDSCNSSLKELHQNWGGQH